MLGFVLSHLNPFPRENVSIDAGSGSSRSVPHVYENVTGKYTAGHAVEQGFVLERSETVWERLLGVFLPGCLEAGALEIISQFLPAQPANS